jgi:hypothetical protein
MNSKTGKRGKKWRWADKGYEDIFLAVQAIYKACYMPDAGRGFTKFFFFRTLMTFDVL